MKVLWVTNIVFPFPASQQGIHASEFGGWVKSLLKFVETEESVELAVATLYNGEKIQRFFDSSTKTLYYLIPGKLNHKYDKSLEQLWRVICDEFSPEIIHLHGTEFSFGLPLLNIQSKAKTVASIQGFASKVGEQYLLGIKNMAIFRSITIRDVLRNDNLFQQQKKFIKRGCIEKQIIKNVDYIIGRTEWDYSVVKHINSNLQYFKNGEILRDSFYKNSWDQTQIEKHSIFISQASYPIKGMHIFLEALKIIKKEYPNVMVYVAGQNIVARNTILEKFKMPGYGKLLYKAMAKNKLDENIRFLGILKEEEVLGFMLKSHVFVLPSILENSSNSLGEAMMIGLPTISSYVGGTPSLVNDNYDGLLYPLHSPELLASKVMKIFENQNLCNKLSINSKNTAANRHEPSKIAKELVCFYQKILEK